MIVKPMCDLAGGWATVPGGPLRWKSALTQGSIQILGRCYQNVVLD